MTLSCPKALLKVRISFCVFFILSAYSEKMRNVLNRLLRKWQILGCLRYTKSSRNTRKRRKDTQRRGYLGKIMVQHEIYFLILTFCKMGRIMLKNISRYCPFKKIPTKLARCSPSYDTAPM